MIYDIAGFVKRFVNHSKDMQREYQPLWYECLGNYLGQIEAQQSTKSNPHGLRDSQESGLPKLRDRETTQIVDTLLAKLMAALFPADGEYIATAPAGREDNIAATTVTRLLRYILLKPEHYPVFLKAMKDMLIFGTGIVQVSWELIERPKTVRQVVVNPATGEDYQVENYVPDFPYYDDPRIRNVELTDFFPDPSADSIDDMIACAKRFHTTAGELRRLAIKDTYDKKAVASALAAGSVGLTDDDDFWMIQKPMNNEMLGDFDPVCGYEYWGEVPAEYVTDGNPWRYIVVVNGVVVKNAPWPLDDHRLPFFDFTINPISGRFYGISPAEIARYDQAFADTVRSLLALAVVRSVLPPIIFNANDNELDLAALADWSPDTPIKSEYPNDIKALAYSTDKYSAFQFLATLKGSAQNASGAPGSIQGQGLGINRASATEAARTFEMALDRPELSARLIEETTLPKLGRAIIGLYKQNLVDTQDLMDRVGELPNPVQLQDIHADYDVKYVGTRLYIKGKTRLQFLDRVYQLMGVSPGFATFMPLAEMARQILEEYGWGDLAQQAGTPETVATNLLLMEQLSGKGIFAGGQDPQSLPGGTPAQNLGEAIPPGEIIEGAV